MGASSNKKNQEKIPWYVTFPARCAIAIAIFYTFFIVVLCAISYNAGDKPLVSPQDGLVSAVFSILAIMITTWLGLTITNTIRAEKVEAIDTKLEDADNRMVELTDDFSELKKDHRSEIVFMLTASGDEMHQSFASELYALRDSELLLVPMKVISGLIEAESLFTRIRQNYYKSFIDEEYQKELCTQGIECLNGIEFDGKSNIRNLVSQLQRYLLSEFYYYYAFAEEHLSHFEEANQSFEKAAKGYVATMKSREESFDEDSPSTLDTKNLNGTQIKDYAYIMNSIGSAYSEMVFNNRRLGMSSETIIMQRAVSYSKAATELSIRCDHERAVYYKNYGTSLERCNNDIASAVKEYAKAVRLDSYNEKNQHVLISAYHKLIKNALSVPDKKPGSPRSKSIARYIKDAPEDKKAEAYLLLQEQKQYLDLAQLCTPFYKSIYGFRAYWCIFSHALETNPEQRVIIEAETKQNNERIKLFGEPKGLLQVALEDSEEYFTTIKKRKVGIRNVRPRLLSY